MTGIEPLKENRKGKEFMENFNMATLSKKTFGMFDGKEETVTILFENYLASVAIDRFGKEVDMRVRDEEHFSVRVKVRVSNQFFGWLAGLSGSAMILSPESVKEDYKDYLKKLLENA
ncbi:MAG: WYL domain-containing protein, partial [Lachnospiraceae bacterium]|nr:WYL domain-containing protein [Lachnospiraceae bacterium]